MCLYTLKFIINFAALKESASHNFQVIKYTRLCCKLHKAD